MKITPARTDSFIKNPDKSIKVVLIYGTDLGLVHERANDISKRIVNDINDPFSCVSLDSARISKDPALLLDEMCSISFFGSDKLIKIRNPDSDISSAVSLVLESTNISNVLVIEEGELSNKSKLRKICEDHAIAAAIPCYTEDAYARKRFIKDFLSEHSISLDSAVLDSVADAMPPNRLAMRSELEKFVTYIGKNKTTSLADVEACFQNASDSSSDDIVLEAASGNSEKAMTMLDFLFDEKTPPIVILRTAQRHYMRLHYIKTKNASGMSVSEIVDNIKPAIFWKHKDIIKGQAAKLSLKKIESVLLRLYETEKLIKSGKVPPETLCSQTMLGLTL